MESSHSTNGNTFQGMGIAVGEARTPTCPATLDYSSLSLHRDPESRSDPCSDSLFRSQTELDERTASICRAFCLTCRSSLMVDVLRLLCDRVDRVFVNDFFLLFPTSRMISRMIIVRRQNKVKVSRIFRVW